MAVGLFGQRIKPRRYHGPPCYCRACRMPMQIFAFGGCPLGIFPVDRSMACDVCRRGDTGDEKANSRTAAESE